MRKWIFSLAFMPLILAANSFAQENFLSVQGMSLSGFSQDNLQKLETAFLVLENVVNSEKFKDRVVNFTNSQGEKKFASNKGLTNEEIYQRFMEGREVLQQETPYEMNFYLKLYYNPFSKVIGYTTPTKNLININWKFFKKYKVNEVAGNLAHEWTHKLGFNHTSAKEHDSAPYGIGYIVNELGIEYLKKNKLP